MYWLAALSRDDLAGGSVMGRLAFDSVMGWLASGSAMGRLAFASVEGWVASGSIMG